jgi:hypothetical protein
VPVKVRRGLTPSSRRVSKSLCKATTAASLCLLANQEKTMINKSKLALIAAIAAVSITSPAFAQSSHGEQVTGSASNRADINRGYYASDFGSQNGLSAYAEISPTYGRIARSRAGLHAFAMTPGAPSGSAADDPALTGGGSYGYNEGLRANQW